MRRATVVLSILVALTFAGRLLAHEGHEHKAMGTVATVDASHLEVTTQQGEKISLALSKETKYLRGKAPAAAGDIKVGERVAVTFIEEAGKKMAREVRLGPTGDK